jgi:hypothetical protein
LVDFLKLLKFVFLLELIPNGLYEEKRERRVNGKGKRGSRRRGRKEER